MQSVQTALVDPPRTATEVVVYYATDGYNVKIGLTNSPRRRGGELRVQMLHTIPGNRLDEARHHRMWRQYRLPGSEWFRPGDELLLWLTTELVVAGRTRELAVLRQLILSTKRSSVA